MRTDKSTSIHRIGKPSRRGRRPNQMKKRDLRLETLEARCLLYGEPFGGWDYLYDGSGDSNGGGFTALDGTWNHFTNTDQWDGSGPGEGRPGGVAAMTDAADDTTFLRLQDTGDPGDYGHSQPANGQLFFGHDISAEGAADDVLDTGVTLTFRTRLSTGVGLDDAHPNGGSETTPWPASGVGYKIHGSGRSNFVIHQSDGGSIGFALALTSDGAEGSPGLLMNNEFGQLGFLADTGRGGRHKQFDVADPTQWQEFWITIEAGGEGTHQVSVYANSDLNPTVFDVTAGTSNDFRGISYLALGLGSTSDSGAFDVDFFGWKDGIHSPTPDFPVDPAAIVNDAAVDVSYFSADVGGTVTATGGHDPRVTLYWGDNDGGTDPEAWDNTVDMGINDGPFSLSLSNLTQHTTYYYRSLATNSAGQTWAATTASFTTLSVNPATIVNTPAEGVTALVATIGATVVATGGEDPDVTLYWGDNDGGTVAATWDYVEEFGIQTSAVSKHLEELSPETTYYYRAAANNQFGPSWADSTSSFTTQTLTLPEVKVDPVSQISAYAAMVTGAVTDVGGDPPEVIVYWGDEDGGSVADQWDHSMSIGIQTGSYTAPLLRLASSTSYYVRTLARNAAGEQWSIFTLTFTTTAASPLRITEFLAANNSDLGTRVRPSSETDFTGDATTPDWLEIHNPSDMPLHLGGLHLTDDNDDPTKWAFPDDSVIEAGDYLVVFASGRNIHDPQLDEHGFLHTNFGLSSDGEYLALTSPAGETIFAFEGVPGQRFDISYGLGDDNAELFFETTTPGSANSTGILLVGDTKFRPDRGFYAEPFQVTITTETLGAEIYYTLDGSEPDPIAGQLYAGPIDVTTTTTLRAAAFKDGYVPTTIDTQTYIFIDDVIQQDNSPDGYPFMWAEGAFGDYEMDPEITQNPAYVDILDDALLSLPSVSIVTDIDNLFDPATGIYMNTREHGAEWERPASVELIFPDGSQGFQENAALRIQGGASREPWKSPKHAFRLNFKGGFGASKLKYDWFGGGAVSEFDTINLRAGFNHSWIHHNTFLGDNRGRAQYVRDQWAKDTQRAMGHASPYNDYAHLYVNGMYWGLYNPTERPTASWAASYWGGLQEDYDVFNAGDLLDGDRDAWDDVLDVVNSGLAGDAEYELFSEMLDIDGFIDYMLLNHYGGNGDWDNHNWYLAGSRQPGGKFRFVSWDAELIFIGKNDNNVRIADAAPGRLFRDAQENEEFMMRLADRVQLHFFHEGLLTPESVIERWNARSDQIAEALVAESARWGDYRRDVDNRGSPLLLLERDVHWMAERNRLMNDYFPDRTNIVIQQYRSAGLFPSFDAPRFSQRGGIVSSLDEIGLMSTEGTIYYTTDGSDPRLKGGDLNPAAIEYTGPFSLDVDTTIRARVLSGDQWSALDQASFVVNVIPADMSNLWITEINYHPHAPTPAERAALPDLDDNEFEFIEIYNAHPTDGISLQGMAISDGVSFSFPTVSLQPGEYAVIVENLAAFELRYGTDANVLGQWSGGLSDNGETLLLTDGSGETVVEMAYRDGDPWPERADGVGATLELADLSSAPSAQSNKHYRWRASSEFGGSPGAPSTAPVGVVINEVMANTGLSALDSIELYNPTSDPIAIGGWYLSDASSNLLKYEIPGDTVIGPDEYLTFDESHFNPNPNDPASNDFALSGARGDDVWLVVPDGTGGVAMFVDDVHFGATLEGESLGRLADSASRLVPLGRDSLGCRNTHARVGPLVITELNYNPGEPSDEALAADADFVEDDLEFIEVYNPLSTPVDLTDWRLRGGADYDFDAGTSLGAGQTLLVLSFEPNDALNAARLQAFRVHYGIDDRVAVVGGFGGQLSDSGEVVRLLRPDLPPADDPDAVPRVTEDEVLYDDLAPWPTAADGNGSSLQREAAVFYGHQAASWSADEPTPGSVDFTGNLAGDLTGDGIVDARDIDLLFDVVHAGSTLTYYDLDGSGSIDTSDAAFLIENIIGTEFGDATLDGYVDGSDFNRWNDAKFHCTGRSWSDGNFTGDDFVDTSDFNIWNDARFSGDGLAAGAQRDARVPRAPLAEAPVPTMSLSDGSESLALRTSDDRVPRAGLVDRWLGNYWLDQQTRHDRSASGGAEPAFVSELLPSDIDVSRFESRTRRLRVHSPSDGTFQDGTDVGSQDRSERYEASVELAIASEVQWSDVLTR